MWFRIEKYNRNSSTRKTRIYEDGRTNYDVSVEKWIESRPVKMSIGNGHEETTMWLQHCTYNSRGKNKDIELQVNTDPYPANVENMVSSYQC